MILQYDFNQVAGVKAGIIPECAAGSRCKREEAGLHDNNNGSN
jgi:hypothetical protein